MTLCDFCEEQEAVKKRMNPNGEWDKSKEIWDICWECDKFINWTMIRMISSMYGSTVEPFDQWLFRTEKVWPKGKYLSSTIQKKEGKQHGKRS